MSQQLDNEVERQGKHVQVFGRTNRGRCPLFGGMTSYVPTNLQQMNLCLRNVSNLLDLEYIFWSIHFEWTQHFSTKNIYSKSSKFDTFLKQRFKKKEGFGNFPVG